MILRFIPFLEDDDTVPAMEGDPLGEYVLYEDYEKEIRIKDMELKVWKDAYRKLAGEM
jgi:hypothetical protein